MNPAQTNHLQKQPAVSALSALIDRELAEEHLTGGGVRFEAFLLPPLPSTFENFSKQI